MCEEEVRWAWVLVVQAAPSRAIPFAPSMPPGRRTRWSGTLAALVSALQVEMPNEIMYEDKVNPRALVLHTPRWRRLKELQPNMSFRRSDVRKALQETARLAEWPLSQADKDEFADVVTDRLMVMLRHISQAGLRGHPPRWYREIFTTGREEVDVEKMSSPSEEEEQEDRGAEEAEEEEAVDNASDFEPLVGQKLDLDRFFEAPRKKPAKASSAAPEWCYGYSPQLEKAWRCCAETPLKKAFTAQFEAGATPLAPVLAVWPDGDRHEVMELTTAAFQARGEAVAAAAKPRGAVPQHYEGRTPEGYPIVVKDRSEGPNRPPLVSLFLSGKQGCQVSLHEVPHAVAVKILVTLGKKLATGEIEKKDLYKERAMLLEKQSEPTGEPKKPTKRNRAKVNPDEASAKEAASGKLGEAVSTGPTDPAPAEKKLAVKKPTPSMSQAMRDVDMSFEEQFDM